MKPTKGKSEYPQQYFVDSDILNSANTLIHIDDLHTQRMVWGNNRFEEMLGFTSGEVIEMGNEYIQKYYHPDDITEIPNIIDYFKNNKGEKHTTLFRVKHKNGSWVYFITTRSFYKNDTRYVVSVSTNLTDDINCGLMFHEFNKIRIANKNKEIIKLFTTREKEIILLISHGFTNDMIAKKLFISVKTVDCHRTNILRKTKLHNSAELINLAKEIGLV
jgi:PAS domain S-box-containing protein